MIRGRIFIVVAAVLASMAPIFIRELQSFDWDALPVASVRGIFGAIILGIIFRSRLSEAKNDIKGVFFTGMALTIGMITYVYAIQHAAMGLVISIVFFGPVWVILYERIFHQVRNRRNGIACLFGFSGTILIAFNWQAGGEVLGFVSAFVSGLMFAWLMIAVDRTSKKVSPEIIAFWTCVISGILLSWSLLWVEWNFQTIKFSVFFGAINGAAYFVLLYSAIKIIASASEVGVWQYIEVAAVWLIGVFFYNEPIHLISLLGTALIVSAGIIISLQKKE